MYLDMDDSSRAEHYMRKAQEVCERARSVKELTKGNNEGKT